jgi:hypothetical protein
LIVDLFLLNFEFYIIELFYTRDVVMVLEGFQPLRDV